ncbi:MAG: PEP-CTERM sorting domain-containing protein [Planctomycetota bacterium]|nr:PEP-CTERM sorting domain-containing protein [Planctomycetota bacterium]
MVTPTGLKGMTRGLGLALVAAVVAGVLAPAALAAPMLYCWLEASTTQGSGYTTGPLAVEDGQTVYYNIRVQMANPSGGAIYNAPTNKTMSTLTESIDGISSMKFNLYELAADPIQADFATASTLNAAAGWAGGTGPSGGVPTVGSGIYARGTYKNLIGIRPIQAAGTFVGVTGSTPTALLISTGSAVVHGSSLTTDSFLKMNAKVPSNSVTNAIIRVNNPYVTASELTAQAGYDADPLTVFGPVGSTASYAGLVLYTPWADAVIPGVDPVTGYVVDLMKNEDLHLMAAVGGSSHTNVEYKWTIMSPEIIVYGRDVIVPSALLATLPGEHHMVRLDVSGDGKSDSMEVPLALVPEPATMALLALGGLAVASVRRRRIR